ncbi:hypothetical protein M5K25_015049 [Dendrobium thyrsiflorum]|uniref:Small multi-drug export n=1 Tax=Dendrobium thyrsiflorum TaxID=117978 RepID=A0ABD0UWK6_DENTH
MAETNRQAGGAALVILREIFMPSQSMASTRALTQTFVFHGRRRNVSLFAFTSRRSTTPSSLPTFLYRRIRTPAKVAFTSEPVPYGLLNKTRCAEIIPQERSVGVPGALSLTQRILPFVLLSVFLSFTCGTSLAAVDDSIRASGFGLKVAAALRKSGWIDEAIVFFLATLPVIELRGAIPVGYWMRLDPLKLTIVSVLGNMVPVPFIVLYLKQFAAFLSKKSSSATRFLELLFERAREKAGPVMEFQWLGLMLFVAVPFPGTGAWTGAIIAAILDMPFWSAVSANFFGVVFAGLLVNLLVNLGLKYAVMVGILLFFISTVMWNVLRSFRST